MNTPVPPAAPARAPLSDRPYCDWPAIIAGAVIAADIWFIWVTVTSFGIGGYLAGRFRMRLPTRSNPATVRTD